MTPVLLIADFIISFIINYQFNCFIMKKLVFAMMAIVALSFASCDKTATGNNESNTDSTTTTVDSLTSDATVNATAVQETSVDSTQAEAPAQEAATESAQENK